MGEESLAVQLRKLADWADGIEEAADPLSLSQKRRVHQQVSSCDVVKVTAEYLRSYQQAVEQEAEKKLTGDIVNHFVDDMTSRGLGDVQMDRIATAVTMRMRDFLLPGSVADAATQTHGPVAGDKGQDRPIAVSAATSGGGGDTGRASRPAVQKHQQQEQSGRKSLPVSRNKRPTVGTENADPNYGKAAAKKQAPAFGFGDETDEETDVSDADTGTGVRVVISPTPVKLLQNRKKETTGGKRHPTAGKKKQPVTGKGQERGKLVDDRADDTDFEWF